MGMHQKFENHSGIYEIKNILNGKRYIGQAKNLRKRKSQHFAKLKRNEHGNQHLQNSFNKYGIENFVFNIILYCELSELTYYEQSVMDVLHPEYNKRPACDSNLGIKQTDETKRKMSKAQKGRKHSEEAIKKMSESKMGHYVSDETIIKLIGSHLGKIPSKETRDKMGIISQGKKHSGSTSQYVGVFFSKKENGWLAQIQYNKKRIRIGLYDNEIDAAIAYNMKAIELFGEQAKINYIESYEIPCENSKRERSSFSEYKGVYIVKSTGRWATSIYKNPKESIYLGTFDTKEEAALAYNKKAIELYGEKAVLNVIEGFNLSIKDYLNYIPKIKRSGSSIYRGVSLDKERNKWMVQIKYNHKTVHLGRFKCEKDAAIAYNIKAIELFGENAKLNIIEEKEE
jgi:group I intron endonuclease